MAGDSVEAKKLGEEIWIAYRANSRHNFGDDSAATMENMKKLGRVHPTFGHQTIDRSLFNQYHISNTYSERYQANSIQYYQPTKSDIKEPSKEEKELREKLIGKFPDTFVEKLGKMIE